MKPVLLILAASLTALAACATPLASDARLQEAASLMVSIGQHGEDANIPDLEAQLDELVQASPNDPYVLKLAAQSRITLSGYSQDRAERVRLRHTALAELERAISLSAPTDKPRAVMVNGQPSQVDFTDLAQLRADLMHQVQTDR